jgi:ABC-type oligopeptide transport system substrate-binding subunit
MYMTDEIDTQVVKEAATRKLMFLKGQLMAYGLQSEDFATYRNSDYVYKTPSETIYFLILNGHKDAITSREAAEDFDTEKYDLQTLLLNSFRRAVAVSYDKELLASTVSPARSGGYGLIGESYIYDPDTGSRYRDTDQAKKALCEFYSVDVDSFASLDEAAKSITGYDPVAAKELYQQAFDDAIAAGYITDNDGDGKSDQMIRIEYCASDVTSFIEKTIAYLNEKMAEVTEGTPFEGKVEFYASAPYGNDWSNKIKTGMSDTVLGGWSGSALNPFSLTDLYADPNRAYDGKWFDATKEIMTLTVDGKEITTDLKTWSDMLNGTTCTVDGVEYNFGADLADVETRLDILAGFETKILGTYDYIPMLQNAGMSLLSQQVYYVVEEYNPIMGRGGITYMKYNYDEAEWADYVNSQPDGTLSY